MAWTDRHSAEVDWASLHHAYGPATDTPELLGRLSSPDAAVRDEALDQLDISVVHQGSIYTATLAAVPILLDLATGSGPGAEPARVLLADIQESLAAATRSDDGSDDDAETADDPPSGSHSGDRATPETPDGPDATGGPAPTGAPATTRGGPRAEFLAGCRRAHALVAAHRETWLDVARTRAGEDREAAFRLAVASAAPPERILDVVRAVLAAEGDADVLEVVVEAAQSADRRPDGPAFRPRAAAWLRDLAAGHPTGRVRLMAWAHLPAVDPGAAQEAVDGLIALMPALGPELPSPIACAHAALDANLPARRRLLLAQISSPNRSVRSITALTTGGYLYRFRDPDPRPVRALGALARDPDLRRHALSTLTDLGPAAAPAAEDLLDIVGQDRASGHAAWSPAGTVLTQTGDRRILPVLREALQRRRTDAYWPAARAGDLLIDLIDPIRRALRRRHEPLQPFVAACLNCPDLARACCKELAALVRRPRDQPDYTLRTAVQALGRLGPKAAAHADLLTALVCTPGIPEALRAQAVEALARITGGTPVVLSAIDNALALPRPEHLALYAQAVTAVGPPAAHLADRLADLAADAGTWDRAHLARALWRADGRKDAAWELSERSWGELRHVRALAAETFQEMGEVRAAPLLEAEIADPIRSRWTPWGHGSDDVAADERLLAACRSALAILGT